jgi:hypothetical protein
MKAIASYEAALQQNPQSFDAIYNRYDSNFPVLPTRRTKKELTPKRQQGTIAVSAWTGSITVAGRFEYITKITSGKGRTESSGVYTPGPRE